MLKPSKLIFPSLTFSFSHVSATPIISNLFIVNCIRTKLIHFTVIFKILAFINKQLKLDLNEHGILPVCWRCSIDLHSISFDLYIFLPVTLKQSSFTADLLLDCIGPHPSHQVCFAQLFQIWWIFSHPYRFHPWFGLDAHEGPCQCYDLLLSGKILQHSFVTWLTIPEGSCIHLEA